MKTQPTLFAKPKKHKGREPFTDRSQLKNRPVSIVLTQATYEAVAARARADRRPEATIIRMLVEDAMGV